MYISQRNVLIVTELCIVQILKIWNNNNKSGLNAEIPSAA